MLPVDEAFNQHIRDVADPSIRPPDWTALLAPALDLLLPECRMDDNIGEEIHAMAKSFFTTLALT